MPCGICESNVGTRFVGYSSDKPLQYADSCEGSVGILTCRYACCNPECPSVKPKLRAYEKKYTDKDKGIRDPAGNRHTPPPLQTPPQKWTPESVHDFAKVRQGVGKTIAAQKKKHAWCGTGSNR